MQNADRRIALAMLGKSHGMRFMVQDLTNPMLAQIPHVLLAAHAGTMMGVETNSMQFYPQASAAEAEFIRACFPASMDRSIFRASVGRGLVTTVRSPARELPAPSPVTESRKSLPLPRWHVRAELTFNCIYNAGQQFLRPANHLERRTCRVKQLPDL